MLIKNLETRSANIEALFFDGSKDKTMYFIKMGNKLYGIFKTEEHITKVQEPGSAYIEHVISPTGTPKDIEIAIFLFV